MKIRNKIGIYLFLIFFLVAAILITVTGFYSYNVTKNQTSSYLLATNTARAEHINTFVKSQKKMSEILAAASVYRDFLKESFDSKQYTIIKDKIDKRLKRTVEIDKNLLEVYILDKNGKVAASSDKEEEGEDRANDLYFIEGKKSSYVKDAYYYEPYDKIVYAISSPIFDDDGKLLGVSVLIMGMENFYDSIIKSENSLGKTEESFLINKDKFFLTPSFFLGDKVILKEKDLAKNADSCFSEKEVSYVKKNGYNGLRSFNGKDSIVEALDYRSVNIIGTHIYIPETGWCLITKIDKSEFLSTTNQMVLIMIYSFIFCLFLFFFTSFFIIRLVSKPILVLMDAVKRVSAGDLDFKIDNSRRDEIGIFSRNFGKMVEAIKKSREDIDKKVKEQTREILEKQKRVEDQAIASLNILEDIEEEKLKADILIKELRKFKLAVDGVSDHISITDKNGIILYANSAMEKITGFKGSEVIGTKAGSKDNWGGHMPTILYKNLWKTIKEKKQVYIGELQNRRKNGEKYDVIVSISPILDNNGDVEFFVEIERDVTKEKQIDRAKTEFVSLASHQLRTPLSAINWYSEMLLAGDAGKLTKKQNDYIEEVYKGNQRMVELVNALLDVSRIELGTFLVEPELVDFKEVANSVINDQLFKIKEKKIKIEKEFDKNLPKVVTDPKLARIIFQNLITNSVKYTPDKGKITVSILNQKPNILIKISDSGYGIPEAQKEKIFTKLFRADNIRQKETDGTGLGLYMVRSVVERSGGKIWFESEENKGTTFYVLIPIEQNGKSKAI